MTCGGRCSLEQPMSQCRPRSGIAANSMATKTGPMPGVDRKSRAMAAEPSSCAITLSIRRSRSPTRGIQHGFDGIIHGPDIGRKGLRLSRADRRCAPFALIDDLRPSCCQSSARTQVLTRQGSSSPWPQQHKPVDQFRIDPVWLRAGAAGNGKGLYLRRGQLLRVDPIARPLRPLRRIPPRRYRPEPRKVRKAAPAATKCLPGLKKADPAGLWRSL